MQLWSLAEEFICVTTYNNYTADRIRTVVKLFIERSGVSNIHQVDFVALSQYKDLSLRVSKAITFNGNLKYLRLLFDYAVDAQYLPDNIFKKIQLAKVGKPQVKHYSPHDVMRVKDAIIASGIEPVWFWLTVAQTLRFTGIRRRQLVTLRLSDINFQENSIRLGYEGSKTKREWVIPLHSRLKLILIDYLDQYESVIGRRLRGEDFLFSVSSLNDRYKNYGSPQMEPTQITGFFKRISKKMNVRAGAHRYRHTLATQLCNPVDDTAPDIFSVQEILGHTNLSTTKAYVAPEFRRMAATIEQIVD